MMADSDFIIINDLLLATKENFIPNFINTRKMSLLNMVQFREKFPNLGSYNILQKHGNKYTTP